MTIQTYKIKFNELLEAISLDDVNKTPGTEEVSVMLGRFQPCTAAHISIIDDAYKKYGNTVVVAVVKSSNDKSPFPFKLISEILQKSTKSKIKVIELKTGFIGDFISIMIRKLKTRNYSFYFFSFIFIKIY
jgi:hypothetical protein